MRDRGAGDLDELRDRFLRFVDLERERSLRDDRCVKEDASLGCTRRDGDRVTEGDLRSSRLFCSLKGLRDLECSLRP